MCGAWVNCHFPNQTCLKCFWDPDEWDLPWVHFFVMSSVVKLSELWYVNIRAIREIARNGINKMKFFGLSLAPVREVPPTSSPFSRGCRERPCQLWWVVKACKSLVTRTGMRLVTTTAWVWPQGPTWGWSQRPQEVGREDRMDIYHSPALHSNMKTYPKYISGAQQTIMLQNLNMGLSLAWGNLLAPCKGTWMPFFSRLSQALAFSLAWGNLLAPSKGTWMRQPMWAYDVPNLQP